MSQLAQQSSIPLADLWSKNMYIKYTSITACSPITMHLEVLKPSCMPSCLLFFWMISRLDHALNSWLLHPDVHLSKLFYGSSIRVLCCAAEFGDPAKYLVSN